MRSSGPTRSSTCSCPTDAAGRFLLVGPAAGEQILLLDGATTTNPPGVYHAVPLKVTLAANTANQLLYQEGEERPDGDPLWLVSGRITGRGRARRVREGPLC